jgi:hypothetical protein
LRYELFDYQESAAAAVSKYLVKAARDYADDADEQTSVVLAAPTGAGKTVIATSVVEASLDGDESTPGIDDATFLWVTDDPSLNRQTLHKMMAASSALAPNRLITIENNFDEELFDPGRVYFLNIQKLSSSATLSKSRVDGRTYSLWETITNTVLKRPYGFAVVIDEAHRGMATARKTRDTIVTQIIGGGATGRPAVPVVWGISATPKRFLSAMSDLGRSTRSHTVRIEDVRASGLLKDQIILGHTRGVDAAESTLDVSGAPSAATALSATDEAAISTDELELAELKDMWTSREISTREYRQMRKTVEDRITTLRRKTIVRPTVEVLTGLVGPDARAAWDRLAEGREVERLNAVLRFLFAAVIINEHRTQRGTFDYSRIEIEPNPL